MLSKLLNRLIHLVHLNGLQALTYARIRKLDSDFMRAGRQRALLGALLTRLKQSLWRPLRMGRLLRVVFQAVDTDLQPNIAAFQLAVYGGGKRG